MKINAHPISETHVIRRLTQQVIKWPIDGGDFGDDANRARH
jgi:hypothetical protein